MEHAEAGSVLLEKWKFSPNITKMVQFHHNPDAFEGDKKDITIMEVSDIIAREGDGLTTFIDQDIGERDNAFLENLQTLNWTWEKLQESKEPILESVSVSQQIISG